MINFLIGFRFISIYIIFVEMVGDDDILEIAAFLFNSLFDTKDLFCLDGMLYPDVTYCSDPLIDRIGCRQG